MRKYVRLINNDFIQDFESKISFKKKKDKYTVLSNDELISITNCFKKRNDIQNLTIFYFLYYSGLNFSTISRILLRNFKKGFQMVYIKKGSLKKIYIPLVIQNCLIKLFREKKNERNYFFYESYLGKKILSRTEYIKREFSFAFNSVNELSKKIKSILLSEFCFQRKYKILTDRFYYLFEFSNLNDNDNFSVFSFESKTYGTKKKKEKNENQQIKKNLNLFDNEEEYKELNFLSIKNINYSFDKSFDSFMKKRLRTPSKAELIKDNELYLKESLISSFE